MFVCVYHCSFLLFNLPFPLFRWWWKAITLHPYYVEFRLGTWNWLHHMQTKLEDSFFFTLVNSLVVNLGCCLLSDCFPRVKKRVCQDSHGEGCALSSSFLLWSSIDSFLFHFATCWLNAKYSIVFLCTPLASQVNAGIMWFGPLYNILVLLCTAWG